MKTTAAPETPSLQAIELLVEEDQLDIDHVKSYLESAHTALKTKITTLKAVEASLIEIKPEKSEALKIVKSRISKLEFLAKNIKATINNANALLASPSENQIPESLKWRIGMLERLADAMRVKKVAKFLAGLFNKVTDMEKSKPVCE